MAMDTVTAAVMGTATGTGTGTEMAMAMVAAMDTLQPRLNE
ncbi:hypothetical protein GCM10023219_24860 [Stakelama sediminis]